MYRSLYFKIVLIFVVFMITVMAVVGTVLLNSVFSFYTRDFVGQLDEQLAPDAPVRSELESVMTYDGYPAIQKDILDAYGTTLGIDTYRNFYILDMNGLFLAGSDEELGRSLTKTPNMLTAMTGGTGTKQPLGSEYSDYAVYLERDGRECIIYIKDSQEEMRQLSWELFSIILQSVLFGLLIAVVLSFFLAKAITGPIQSLTHGAQLISAGEFAHEIDVHSRDEIGTLTSTFNHMKQVLKNTLDEVTGERRKLETVMACLKDAVIAFTDRGRMIHINKSALELLGSDYRETMTLSDFTKLLCIEYVQGELSKLSGEGSYVVRNVEYGSSEQGSRALDINFSVLKYIEDNRTRDGLIVVMHDITSRYELDKAQREFVANVSHELRTPLTVIKGSVESIQLYPDMDAQMRDTFLENAVQESDRMLRIIGDLLTLSRLDNNKTKWEISTFDPIKVLTRLCDIMQNDAKSHNHTLRFERQGGLPMITADKEKIEQVVINIISNSIKYTPDGGLIILRARSDDESIFISVSDNGVGIPEEDLPRLFERFYRVEKARTTDTGGTGLGLAIAKEIAEAHGGTIGIRSKVGSGTEVTIELPIKCGITA
nr:HAMP domain-containing protein [Clostridia bacterium]